MAVFGESDLEKAAEEGAKYEAQLIEGSKAFQRHAESGNKSKHGIVISEEETDEAHKADKADKNLSGNAAKAIDYSGQVTVTGSCTCGEASFKASFDGKSVEVVQSQVADVSSAPYSASAKSSENRDSQRGPYSVNTGSEALNASYK